MTACRIVRWLEDPAGTVVRAKEHSRKWHSLWEGDGDSGRYHLRTPLGSVEGTYVVDSNVVTFVVEKKSRLIPQAVLERVLDDFLGAGARRV